MRDQKICVPDQVHVPCFVGSLIAHEGNAGLADAHIECERRDRAMWDAYCANLDSVFIEHIQRSRANVELDDFDPVRLPLAREPPRYG